METNYKDIHIGSLIKEVSGIKNISISRACTYLNCNKKTILSMFEEETLDSGILLKWSKLLDYNFFMFYHTHLQLYKPVASTAKIKTVNNENGSYDFRKNLYSPEIIDWLLKQMDSGELSINEIMEKYKIPKTTVYRWKKKSANVEKGTVAKKKVI